VQPVDDSGKPIGEEGEHQVPHGKHPRVHTGDYVKEGDALVVGPLVPHDILRISGIEAVQNYLVREVQSVYRSQHVDVDDEHMGVLSKVKATDQTSLLPSRVLSMPHMHNSSDGNLPHMLSMRYMPGSETGLQPGAVLDKSASWTLNNRLKECARAMEPGEQECAKVMDVSESKVQGAEIITKDQRARLGAEGKATSTYQTPTPATCGTQFLRVTKAAVQPASSISAASVQETTKVLTEGVLLGEVC
jgi:DNA-directed RNA polymerase subunit beta'